jgi:hypothetical protein
MDEKFLKRNQRAYQKLLSRICSKCKPEKDSDKIPCCFGDDYIKNPVLKAKIRQRNDFHEPIIKKEFNDDGLVVGYIENPPCSAYNPKVGCIAPKFRPPTCRAYYCNEWEGIDKKIVLRGRFKELTIEGLVNHVKRVRPYVQDSLPTRYLILTDDPQDVGDLMKGLHYTMSVVTGYDVPKDVFKPTRVIRSKKEFGFDVHVDVNASLDSLNPVFKDGEVIITNTSLESLLINDIDDPSKWSGIKERVLDRFLFIIS